MSAQTPVSKQWITRYGLMYLGQNVAWAGPTQILLALQVLHQIPDRKEFAFAILMTVGGLFQALGGFFGGVLSDRTRTRWGRRHPWIIAGSLVAVVMLGLLAPSPSYPVLMVVWAVFQFANSAGINATLALTPDTAPASQFGLVSGIAGVTYTLGVVVGTLASSELPTPVAYGVLAVILVIAVAQFVFWRGGRPPSNVDGTGDVLLEKMQEGRLLGGSDSAPTSYHDFIWVFAARFLVNLGNFIALFYLLYYLRDQIGVADPDTGVLILTGIYAVCVVITAFASGVLSDRYRVRRPFVAVASLGVAAASLMLAFVDSFAWVVAGAVVLGLSWGVFTAVDQALVNEVLPDERRRARDVGIMNITIAGANVLSPLMAAFALAVLGGYPGLYVMSAALVTCGAALVYRVRSVR